MSAFYVNTKNYWWYIDVVKFRIVLGQRNVLRTTRSEREEGKIKKERTATFELPHSQHIRITTDDEESFRTVSCSEMFVRHHDAKQRFVASKTLHVSTHLGNHHRT